MKNFIAIALLVVAFALPTAYLMTPDKTVCIDRHEIQNNYTFAGKVVLKDGSSYNIGTKACAEFWTGTRTHVTYYYKWFK